MANKVNNQKKTGTPLVKGATYDVVDAISVATICDLYKKQFDIDVSRFFTAIDTVEIRKCKVSNYKYYYPLNLEGDAPFYDELSSVLPYYSNRAWQFDQAKKVIQPDERVLDVGCGSGIFLEQLKSITPNLYGLEFNPKAIQECKKKNIEVFSMDLKNMSNSKEGKFDVITYFQVLEHIADVHAFVQDSVNLLKPNGKLIIAVPNNNPYLYKYDKFHVLNLPPHHMGLWDENALRFFPQIFDLSMIKIMIEPLDNFGHWSRLQLKNKLGFNLLPNIKIVNKTMEKIGGLINHKIEGRNIIAIYEKKPSTEANQKRI